MGMPLGKGMAPQTRPAKGFFWATRSFLPTRCALGCIEGRVRPARSRGTNRGTSDPEEFVSARRKLLPSQWPLVDIGEVVYLRRPVVENGQVREMAGSVVADGHFQDLDCH